jgi:hypothetical protein
MAESTQEKVDLKLPIEEPKYLKLTLKYHKLFSQTVQVNPKESLAELKQYLSESTFFHIYDNLHF